ncbi:hypothetical protein AAG570_012418 [Ranatra chinensis]|uniref:Uncharacterized protein n=1 Tax=Ranatra chinensis TaxID=642074 RepID=A0ABD0YX61_9HEMI
MSSKPRNMFYQNKKREKMEIGWSPARAVEKGEHGDPEGRGSGSGTISCTNGAHFRFHSNGYCYVDRDQWNTRIRWYSILRLSPSPLKTSSDGQSPQCRSPSCSYFGASRAV